MPVSHASPDISAYAGSTKYMTPRTPRTPKTPDENGNSGLGKRAGFRHLDERHRDKHQLLMERVKRHGAMKRSGNSFNKHVSMEDKPRLKELLKIGQSAGQVSLGSLESLREFSHTRDTLAKPPNYTTMIQEDAKVYRNAVHRAAAELVKKQRAVAYIDLVREEYPPYSILPSSSGVYDKAGSRTKQFVVASNPEKALVTKVHPRFEVLERVDHACSKTGVGILAANKQRQKLAQEEARRMADTLDQVPATYASWKRLDEGRQARVARFLQLPDEQKDADVYQKRWKREDAMKLYQEYKNEPEFQAEVNKVLAKRVTTDPRRRPSLANGPSTTSVS